MPKWQFSPVMPFCKLNYRLHLIARLASAKITPGFTLLLLIFNGFFMQGLLVKCKIMLILYNKVKDKDFHTVPYGSP